MNKKLVLASERTPSKKSNTRLMIFLSAASAATFYYRQISRNKNSTLDAVYSTTAMTTPGLLAIKTGIELYQGK